MAANRESVKVMRQARSRSNISLGRADLDLDIRARARAQASARSKDKKNRKDERMMLIVVVATNGQGKARLHAQEYAKYPPHLAELVVEIINSIPATKASTHQMPNSERRSLLHDDDDACLNQTTSATRP